MEDTQIIALYWNRNENAIEHTRTKYGGYLITVAQNILKNHEDSEECVGDTYLKVWNAIPKDRPAIFSAYIGKITRNLALNRYAQRTAKKRGGGEVPLLLGELEDCLPSPGSVEEASELGMITHAINTFLAGLKEERRVLFIRRYWYAEPIAELARHTGYSESKVKSLLFRLRNNLKIHLEKEGISL